jgi:hypothetical protein
MVRKRAARRRAARFVCPNGGDKFYERYRHPMLIKYSSLALLIALAAVTLIADLPNPYP